MALTGRVAAPLLAQSRRLGRTRPDARRPGQRGLAAHAGCTPALGMANRPFRLGQPFTAPPASSNCSPASDRVLPQQWICSRLRRGGQCCPSPKQGGGCNATRKFTTSELAKARIFKYIPQADARGPEPAGARNRFNGPPFPPPFCSRIEQSQWGQKAYF